MSCTEQRATLNYLRGELSEKQAARAMQHLRGCADCRESFRFGADTITAATHEAESTSDEAPERIDTPVLRAGLTSWLLPRANPRQGARWFMLLAVGVACFAFLRPKGTAASGDPDAQDLAWAHLQEGTPVVSSPVGDHPGRPRIVTALVPPAVNRFQLLVIDADGHVAAAQEFVAGEKGCSVSDVTLERRSGKCKARQVVIPFPSEEALSLRTSVSYGVAVAVPGALLSAASTFKILPAVEAGVESH